jgi:hypothetical protein
MRKSFAFLAGNSNNTIRFLVCLVILALAEGCAATPQQTVPSPVYSDSASQSAVKAGVQAIANCAGEQTLAKLESRAPDYSRARESLAGALAVLQPGKINPGRPEYERIALYFSGALEGMDRIILGQKENDQAGEALGWKIFDQSTQDLLLMLEPYAGPAAKGRARGQ